MIRFHSHSLLSAAILISLSFSSAFASGSEPETSKAPSVASVTVAPAVQAHMVERIPFSGTLVPRQEVLIYPQVSGSTVDTLEVDIGDLVAEGDVLATLNNRTLTAQHSQAQAEFARAQASVSQAQNQITSATATATRTTSALSRAQRLIEAGTTTQSALDQALADSQTANAALASATDGLAVAQAQLQQAQAQLDIAALNLERATLRAPVDGLISAKNGQIGAIAASGGEPIFRMITDGIVEAKAEVIETDLGMISKGDPTDLTVAGIGKVSGEVRHISPTVDPVNRLGTIRITPTDLSGLRSGVFVSGWIITAERDALTVPNSAVLTDANGDFVLVVNDTILERRPVTVGLIWDGRREIADGLDLDELVVAKAGSFFGDGDQINPILPTAAGE